MSIVVVNHLSLDGVLQGPGRPDEDTRGDFRHGGWAQAGMSGDDPAVDAAMGEVMSGRFSWLFGRHSYDGMLGHWNAVGGPFKDGLNGATKYVATRHPEADLPWPNSVAVSGDVPAEVARIRDETGDTLVIMGSGELIRSLLTHDLVDELLLMVHPVVLGSGMRLFGPDHDPRRWRLLGADHTERGVIVTRYAAVR